MAFNLFRSILRSYSFSRAWRRSPVISSEHNEPGSNPHTDTASSERRSVQQSSSILADINDPHQVIIIERQIGKVREANARELLVRQIEAIDAEIDKEVYDLYGLSEEEIRMVEEAVG